MAGLKSTRFSRYCDILLAHMRITKKKLFHALFDWTNNNSSYFEATAFYPFMDGNRPLPDVFTDAFKFTPNAFDEAKKCISEKLIKHITKEDELKKQLVKYIKEELNLSHDIEKYLTVDLKEHADIFHASILFMVLTGSQQLPSLKSKEEYKNTLLTKIPTPSTYFLGREDELLKISDTLSTFGICYVWGISGIGKSDVVCKYAKTHKANYENIVYIRYHKSINASISMLEYLNTSDTYSLAERFNMNSKVLNSYGKETLVILDNFDIPSENDPDFGWLIGCDFDLIITSRIKPLDIPAIHIEPLSPEQTIKLFMLHLGSTNNVTEETIQEICQKLAYHTLATILVAKAINFTELSVEKIKAALDRSLADLPSQTAIPLTKDSSVKSEIYSNFIAELFTFANLNRPERFLLSMLAVMPLDGITKAQFLSYTGEKTLDVINSFVRLGYVEQNADTISMHPLIADTCIKTMSDVLSSAIKELLSNFFFDVYKQKSYPSVEEQLIAVSICEIILQHPEYDMTQAMIDLTSFFTKCGQYWHTVDTSEYVISHKDALNENEKDYSVALSSYYKGLAHLQLGDKKEAKQCLKETILILGEKDDFSLNEAELFFNAVIEHASCEDDPAQCIEELQKIKIDKDCMPDNDYEMLLCRISFKIASNYLLLNENEKAKELFNESLIIRNKVLGEDSISSALAIGNIAYTFHKMGKYDTAAEYYERGIHILSKHYPANHINLIRMHLNCATAYYCAAPTAQNKMLSDLHFRLASESTEKAVVENRTPKKKKGFFHSLTEPMTIYRLANSDMSIDELYSNIHMEILPNTGPDIGERISKFRDTYHPHGDSSIYLNDYIEKIKLDKKSTE